MAGRGELDDLLAVPFGPRFSRPDPGIRLLNSDCRNEISMFKVSVILIFFAFATSCSFRVFENGHFETNRLPKPVSDSVLELSLSNNVKIPDSAIEIVKTVIKAPLQKLYSYNDLVIYAKYEASKLGGNVIKVTEFHGLFGTIYLRQAIFTTVYKINDPALSIFKKQLDSEKKAYSDSIKTIAIVHLKDFDDQGKRPIFFNDTMIAKIKGVGFDSVRKPGRKDFVFHQDGVLGIDKERLDIKIGNEYFIVLYTTLGKHTFYYHYKIVDKEHFNNKLL